LVDFFKSSSLKLLNQMNWNLVESTYGRFCIKFPQSRMKGKQHRLSPLMPLVSNVMGNFRIIEFISLSILGTIYFNGGKSWQKNIKTTQESLFQRYCGHGKSLETGILFIVPIARYSQPLPRLSIRC
jgi:hypothetical protein